MDITVRKLKDKTGRKIIGYKAEYGELHAGGATSAEAKAKLEELIPNVIEHLQHVPTVFAFNGYASTIFPVACGEWLSWDSMTVCPDGHVCTVGQSTPDIEKAESSVRMHIAQMCYPALSADDCCKVLKRSDDIAEFRGWVRFQEQFKELRALGYSENECHGIACGNPHMMSYESAVAARA